MKLLSKSPVDSSGILVLPWLN